MLKKMFSSKNWKLFVDKGIPLLMKGLFCLSLGMVFVGFVCIKIWGSFSPDFKGPIINLKKVADLFSNDTNYAYALLNFALLPFIVGTGMLITSANYFANHIKGEGGILITKVLSSFLVAGILVFFLIRSLTSSAMFTSADGIIWFLIITWLCLSYLFAIGIFLLKRLYLWVQNEDGTTNMTKITMLWTIIATVIGWKIAS
ncbi:hypothetical protein KG086_09185 [Lacticaseibacillus chiayiensis]|uniref:hypothetical protein n=1 Tax=Lacticaseibacillus chiayiensis TaxID=2100821 RepID=UPI001BCFD254|nr:hypothetical protein [Lacticaseibacillus chiayiensis]QVI33969.1 hypothetical protein KG086_09185 [Lacticaseibacillus chiayiensis]